MSKEKAIVVDTSIGVDAQAIGKNALLKEQQQAENKRKSKIKSQREKFNSYFRK